MSEEVKEVVETEGKEVVLTLKGGDIDLVFLGISMFSKNLKPEQVELEEKALSIKKKIISGLQ